VMHLLASTRAAMAGLMAEVVEDHIRNHLADPEQHPGALNGEAVEELLAVVRSYLK
jgi:DNA-binding FrmR family transcriptional regulator